MPTYEYRCEKGHDFEAFQRMSDPPLTECPECGAPAERRISAGTGLVFKGSGFYITDYKKADEAKARGKRKAAEKKDSGGSGDDGGGGESGKSSASAGDGSSGAGNEAAD